LPENPLLPNAKLKELYALMQRARALSKAPATTPRFEAILASTLMHVEPGDYVSPPPGAPAAALLASERTSPPTRGKSKPAAPATPLPAHQRLATAAGIAQGLKLADTRRFALVYTDAGPASARNEEGWAEALAYATHAGLPLLLVCADVSGARTANPNAITWQSISKVAKALRLPVLTVDGTDAAALYRVMQESAHRARQGDGCAVIWCILPSAAERSAANDPIRIMKRYLDVRGLAPKPAKKAAPKKRLR
jgi:pyruvate dehydrogenase E1 component alpha subunit